MRKRSFESVNEIRGWLLPVILMLTPVVNAAGSSIPDYRISVGNTRQSEVVQASAAFNIGSPQALSIDHLVFAVGIVSSSTNDEVFVSFGPKWRWSPRNRNLYIDFGFSPTLFSGSSFGGQDLGGKFHFTSSFSVGSRLGHFENTFVSLRIQHTSNGGLNRPNPGMDMIGLEFSFNARK